QPVRVDDRDRPPHAAQREALVVRGDGAALDRRRHARSRTAVSEDHRLPRPRHPRHRDRTRPRPPSRKPSPPPTEGGPEYCANPSACGEPGPGCRPLSRASDELPEPARSYTTDSHPDRKRLIIRTCFPRRSTREAATSTSLTRSPAAGTSI